MQQKVSGETPFKVMKDTCAVAPTSAGYTLAYSADKINWTAYTEATPAGENLIVNGLTPYMWLKLSGNTDNNVLVIL